MRTSLSVIVFLAYVIAPARAADIAIDDLLGRWCQSDGPPHTFTRTEMIVGFENDFKKTIKIAKTEVLGRKINVMWYPIKPEFNSVFVLSDDNIVLTQLANKTGTNNPNGKPGPRRDFRRC